MASGGPGRGQGRKKGSRNVKTIIKDEATATATNGQPPQLPDNPILPVDYMLRVLNDPNASEDRKDRIASIAAPYLHAKAEAKGTKKDGLMKRAGEVAEGRFGARPAPNVIPIKKQG